MKAGDLFHQLLKSAGFDTTDKAFIDVLSKAEFANTELPESITSALTTNLLTIDAAKNNPTLKKHFVGNALDPINKGIEELIAEYGIDEVTKAEILADQNTYNKYKVAAKKIAELKEKSAGSTNKGEKADLERQINELNKQLSLVATDTQSKIDTIKNEYEQRILNREIDYTLSSKPLPGQFDRDVEVNIARQFVDKALATKGAVIRTIDGRIAVKQKDNPEMDIFENGKPLTFDALTDMALAENKFIKVSNPNNGGGNNGGNPRQGVQAPPQNTTTNAALAQIDAALSGFSE
jgi:hypothetical protein